MRSETLPHENYESISMAVIWSSGEIGNAKKKEIIYISHQPAFQVGPDLDIKKTVLFYRIRLAAVLLIYQVYL